MHTYGDGYINTLVEYILTNRCNIYLKLQQTTQAYNGIELKQMEHTGSSHTAMQ